jgi:hypothetical protein
VGIQLPTEMRSITKNAASFTERFYYFTLFSECLVESGIVGILISTEMRSITKNVTSFTESFTILPFLVHV